MMNKWVVKGKQGEKQVPSAYFLEGCTERFMNVHLALREAQIKGTYRKKKVALCMSIEQTKSLVQKTETRHNVCP